MALFRMKLRIFGLMVALLAGMFLGLWTAIGTTPSHRVSRYSPARSADNFMTYDFESLIQRTTGCIKRVHIFGSYDAMKHVPEINSFKNLFHASSVLPLYETEIDCRSEGHDCNIVLTVGADVEMIKGKDAIVFGFVPMQFRKGGDGLLSKVLELTPEPGQTWIYFSTETPLRVLRWTADLNFGRLKYHVLMTYDRDSDIILPFGYYRPFNESSKNTTTPRALPRREGLMSWMASNCRGFWPRLQLVNRLDKALALDTYGKCGRAECLPKRSTKCNNLMAQYKFYLTTPNSECRDYITEKFWMMSLKYGTVPVVIGAKKENYERVAPPNSFIHAADFGNIEELAEYIKRLDKDDAEYRKYYDWRSRGDVVLTFPMTPNVFCKALPHLKVRRKLSQLKYLSSSPWYRGCRMSADRTAFDLSREEEKELFDLDNWSVWR